ncbi:MAG: hypothetical protein E7665_00995 [Ruminococcaceae bacterium]|nr:hypothetical protein [Oscillospiraceae bacterium]
MKKILLYFALTVLTIFVASASGTAIKTPDEIQAYYDNGLTQEGYNTLRRTFDEFDKQIILQRMQVIESNSSKENEVLVRSRNDDYYHKFSIDDDAFLVVYFDRNFFFHIKNEFADTIDALKSKTAQYSTVYGKEYSPQLYIFSDHIEKNDYLTYGMEERAVYRDDCKIDYFHAGLLTFYDLQKGYTYVNGRKTEIVDFIIVKTNIWETVVFLYTKEGLIVRLMYLVQEAGDSDDWYYTLDRHIDFTWNSFIYEIEQYWKYHEAANYDFGVRHNYKKPIMYDEQYRRINFWDYLQNKSKYNEEEKELREKYKDDPNAPWNSPSYKGIKLGNNVQTSPETQAPVQETPNEINTDKSLPKNLVSTFVPLAVLLAAVCAFVLKRD